MKHPSSIDLEAYACEPAGSDPRGAHAKVREHLALCSACCDYVERITSFAQAAQPPAADVAAHVARAMQGSLEHAPDAPHARVAG
ncbi:MAG: hypothetical protein JWP97_5155, partial [Labilithrix sp.]|nr:hypothetical protein [Labilithrix sp.]